MVKGGDTVSEIKMDMRLKQALRISPQILQSTLILQMNAQDLREYVDRVLEENPVLDKASEHEAQREFQELCRQAGWISRRSVRTAPSGEEPYHPEAGAWDAALTSLPAFLSDQLDRRVLPKPLRELCQYLVQALDEDGFLEQEDIDAVCALGVPQEMVQQAVAALQALEPAGIAARDLPECLLLQLRRRPENTALAQRIAASYLPLLGKKRWRALAEKLDVSEQEVQQAAALISSLSPHPGRMETAETASPEYITPDVFVVEHDGALDVVLNDFYVPQIRINGYYAALLTETEDPETKEFLRQKMQQAQWVMAHMERRRKTLERCARLILATHLPFFQGTTLCLAPFMQKDAAERMEVHASTLGRCIRGKYLQCRQGTYPLQYFFPRPVDSTGRCSEQAVRVKLAQYMKDEDPHHPLSDQRLSELLLAEDIPAARRTVAKYRELMGIPPAYGRRK